MLLHDRTIGKGYLYRIRRRFQAQVLLPSHLRKHFQVAGIVTQLFKINVQIFDAQLLFTALLFKGASFAQFFQIVLQPGEIAEIGFFVLFQFAQELFFFLGESGFAAAIQIRKFKRHILLRLFLYVMGFHLHPDTVLLKVALFRLGCFTRDIGAFQHVIQFAVGEGNLFLIGIQYGFSLGFCHTYLLGRDVPYYYRNLILPINLILPL